MIKECGTCGKKYLKEDDLFRHTSFWRLDNSNNLYFNCECNSTLMIPYKKYDWFSPEKTLSQEASDVFTSFSLKRSIPNFRKEVVNLQRLLNNPEVEISDLATALKNEPMIAADVLKISNSLAKNRSLPKITKLDHAISYIGLDTIKEVVKLASLRSLEFKTTAFNTNSFWSEGILVGMIAEKLASDMGFTEVSDEVYIAGSLANIGKLIYAICLPKLADQIFIESQELQLSWAGTEASLGFPDHSVLGEIAATFFEFPPYIVRAAIGHHRKSDHNSRKTEPAEDRQRVSLVVIANQLKYDLLSRPYERDSNLLHESAESLGLTHVDLNSFKKSISKIRHDLPKLL